MRRLLVIGLFVVLAACAEASSADETVPVPVPLPTSTAVPVPSSTSTSTTSTSTTTTTTTTTLPSTAGLTLEAVETIWGELSPKSVVATGNGLFFAQNMMYRHTISIYDQDRGLVATVPDTVELAAFGIEGYEGEYRGAPVEAAATSDGAFVYVSNYQMYGPGFSNPGDDDCNRGNWDTSFIFRVSTTSLAIDQVIGVGAVPKFVAVTPDDSTVLVTNWCSFDLSVIDAATGTETARVPIGRHPRGIAITNDGALAYVAVMGSYDVAVVNLETLEVGWFEGIGASPRHVVLSPDDSLLYVTLNGASRVVVVDTASGEVVGSVSSGSAPRSMAISDDGASLYVVNYLSDTVTKIDTSTLEVTQTFDVPPRPIGVAFDSETRTVWVASYTGALSVFQER